MDRLSHSAAGTHGGFKSPEFQTETLPSSASCRTLPSPLGMAVPCPRTRGDERTRAAATQAFLKLVGVIAAQFGKTRPDVARRRALVAAATMIGALTMSRIVTDSELSAAILRQTERHLIRTAGATDGLSKSASEA
jgi:hypothetical protein